MGAPLTEFVFESVIRDGLGELRANPALLDDIFSRFLEAHFGTQYGQSKIDELKTYIANNQIKIVQSWAMVPTRLPCISIQLDTSIEDPDIQNLSNEFEDFDETITPTVIVDPVTPGTYDTVTGKLTITTGDLSLVCPGMNYVDNSGVTFKIISASNVSGNKFLFIDKGQSPDLGGDGRVESALNIKRTERRMIRLNENIRLGCHANNDVHIAKYIYYILTFILKSRQKSLIDRGISLDFGSGSVYDRDDTFEGEHVFSRFIVVNCLSQFDWDQEEVNLVDCFDLTVKVNDPNPDDEDTVVTSPSEE